MGASCHSSLLAYSTRFSQKASQSPGGLMLAHIITLRKGDEDLRGLSILAAYFVEQTCSRSKSSQTSPTVAGYGRAGASHWPGSAFRGASQRSSTSRLYIFHKRDLLARYDGMARCGTHPNAAKQAENLATLTSTLLRHERDGGGITLRLAQAARLARRAELERDLGSVAGKFRNGHWTQERTKTCERAARSQSDSGLLQLISRSRRDSDWSSHRNLMNAALK